ncbi:MurR/RpiR family transcriptional regulator [Paenibacillus harenae]|uniref:DNA-binding MurR/RpiR family transcriptional regulator n=1 Tax=Paenibacillus harenae TaxID=306543 RepID=A0ABT9TWD0_PAEHA|nr:MurR/RpiR family transcriptional regulator [Paenibacillus harenae]MDQ0111676.1 DNA-binding MurR/RpiR family transcriptional regulator [Paenibacillus harenae]
MAQNMLGKIRSYQTRFSEKEKKIAGYILENPEKIIHSTISEVADDLHVAEATVFRFCKHIGYKGYQAMKIALASEIMTPAQQVYEEINESDDEKTIAEKIFKSNIRTLENTYQLLDGEAFRKAVELLSQAKNIYFYGIGGSSVIAMDAVHKFYRCGKQAFAFTDAHFQLMSASQLDKNDVAVILSHSGTNRDTLRILKTASDNGARTIGITGFPKSPISQNVDVALHTSSEETEYRSEALASRIGQLSLIDALYVNVLIANKDIAKQSLEKIRQAISETRL